MYFSPIRSTGFPDKISKYYKKNLVNLTKANKL